jgi:ribosomal protein S21
MKIIVRNNDPLKAYKVLTKKLKEDGTFNTLKDKQFFKSKGEKRRVKMKRAIAKQIKNSAKQLILFEKQENQIPRKKDNNVRRITAKPIRN